MKNGTEGGEGSGRTRTGIRTSALPRVGEGAQKLARVPGRVNDSVAPAACFVLPPLREAVYLWKLPSHPVNSRIHPSSRVAPHLAAFLMLAGIACGGRTTNADASGAPSPSTQGSAQQPATQGAAPGSLSRFASLKVMLLPLQGARTEALPAWQAEAGAAGALARSADRAFEAALGERGLATLWIFPAAMERSARRNPTYVTDPYQLRAALAVRAALRKPSDPISEPFASQLRALAGVSDSRYAILPLELRFEPGGAPSAGRPRLHVVAIDSRAAQVVWAGEVVGADAASYSAAVLADIAQRLADLVVPR